MTCIGTLGLVLQRWAPAVQRTGVLDAGFLVWPGRTLLAAVVGVQDATRVSGPSGEYLIESDRCCRLTYPAARILAA